MAAQGNLSLIDVCERLAHQAAALPATGRAGSAAWGRSSAGGGVDAHDPNQKKRKRRFFFFKYITSNILAVPGENRGEGDCQGFIVFLFFFKAAQ